MDKFYNSFEKYSLPILARGVKMPIFVPTKEQYEYVGLTPKNSNLEFFKKLCEIGFDEKTKNKIDSKLHYKYHERLKEEIDIIEELGFIDYILMVWDISDFCDKAGIPRGPGRGSSASSLACFYLKITSIDVIEHGTIFARFLNTSRAKSQIIDGIKYIDGSLVCDIDNDRCYFRRHEIIEYIAKRYPNRTSKLLTTSYLTSKILLKSVYKYYENINEDEANRVSSMIKKVFGTPESIDESLKSNDEFKIWAKDHQKTVNLMLKIQNLALNSGQHASAVLISFDPIAEVIPLKLSKEKEVISGFDMYSAQNVLIKFDELGLKTVSAIDKVCKMVGINPDDIDIHDKVIYDYLNKSDLFYGIFQFESNAQGRVAKAVKPKNFEQGVACLSISRPGASDYLKQYLDYIHEDIYKPIHPLIDDVLKPTGGVCLFQEQYLKMLINIGFTPTESEWARKILGKKLVEKVPEVKKKIEEVCIKNGHPKEIVDTLLKIAEDSGGYQFSLAHSCCYFKITCQTIFLKAKYPKEFFTVNLQMTNEEADSTDLIKQIKAELPYFGIELKPPNICYSESDFGINGDNIYFGFSGIRGIKDKAIEKLKKFKLQTANKFQVFAAAKEVKLSISVFGSLILCGYLDNYLTESRIKTLAEACLWNLLTTREQNFAIQYGEQYNFHLINTVKALNEVIVDEKGKPIIKSSRRDTLRKHFAPYNEIYKNNIKNAQLSYYFFEKKLLGFSHSTNLYELFKDSCELNKISEVKTGLNDEYYKVIGEVVECWEKTSKNDNKYLKVLIENVDGQLPCFLFNSKGRNGFVDKIALHEEDNGRRVKEGDIIIAKGRRKDDALFCDYISQQPVNIIERISQVEKIKE
jgi:DNA polymerase-3 subunit alpha